MPGYVFKIQLSETNIWRQIVVPQDISFHNLHKTIQFSMGWENRHLYTFKPLESNIVFLETKAECDEYEYMQRQRINYMMQSGKPMKEQTLSAYRVSRTTKIDKYLKDYSRYLYCYDMGDNWEHIITFESALDDYPYPYPMIIAGEGQCPPEDCGGVPGYEYMCEVLQNPQHAEYASYREWLGESYFEQCEFNIAQTNYAMSKVLTLKRKRKVKVYEIV